MLTTLNRLRKEELDSAFQSFRPALENLTRHIGAVKTFLAVGAGEGYFDLQAAEVLRPHRIILTDIESCLAVTLPENAEFLIADVCACSFLEDFQNRADLIFCSQVLHETADAIAAAKNIFAALPHGGVALVYDFSESGFAKTGENAKKSSKAAQRHHQADIANATYQKLHTDICIEAFWYSQIFPHFAGEKFLMINGEMYLAGFCKDRQR